jgi:DNA polymerase III alpha subunit
VSKVVGHCGFPVVGTAAQSGFVFPEFDKCQNTQRVVRSQIQSKFEYIKRGRSSIGGAMLNLVHTPPTKCGKRVMSLTLEDEMGLFDVVVFSKAQSRYAKLILTSEVLTIEGRLQRKGVKGRAVSMIMQRALVGLCGPLTKLLGYVAHKRVGNKTQVTRNAELKSVCVDSEDNDVRKQLPLVF